jgi:membrane protein YqaA with SNARE-associated domain
MVLISLFVSAFTSATFLPGSSEALFLFLLSQDNWPVWLLIIVAGTGNSLGGMTNWMVGFLIRKGLFKKKFKKTTDIGSEQKNKHSGIEYIRAEQWLRKYGSPALFFSFLPIIGDPFCFVAGLIRIHWFKALFYLSMGKFFRYFALSYLPL